MFQGDGVVQNLHKVWSNLYSGNVDYDRVRRVTGLGGASVVDSDHTEPIHDAVPIIYGFT